MPTRHRPFIPQLSQLATVPYLQAHRYQVPDGPGIYLIHDLRGVLYAGRSISLRRRWEEHFWERNNWALARALRKPVGQLTFSWVEAEYEQLAALERSLIQFFTPPCNKVLFKNSSNK